VQWSGNLVYGAWSNLVSTLAGNGFTNTVADPITTNQARYYRVVQQP
jgi:hypothetical protein